MKPINDLLKLKRIYDFDFGKSISEETQQRIKEIDNNSRYAIMNAHKIWSD